MKGKASFFVDFDKRDIDDETLIVAQVLDANNNIVDFTETAPIPSRRTSFSPAIDYQINANHTLVARYNYTKNTSRARRWRLFIAFARVRHREHRAEYSVHGNRDHQQDDR